MGFPSWETLQSRNATPAKERLTYIPLIVERWWMLISEFKNTNDWPSLQCCITIWTIADLVCQTKQQLYALKKLNNGNFIKIQQIDHLKICRTQTGHSWLLVIITHSTKIAEAIQFRIDEMRHKRLFCCCCCLQVGSLKMEFFQNRSQIRHFNSLLTSQKNFSNRPIAFEYPSLSNIRISQCLVEWNEESSNLFVILQQ